MDCRENWKREGVDEKIMHVENVWTATNTGSVFVAKEIFIIVLNKSQLKKTIIKRE